MAYSRCKELHSPPRTRIRPPCTAYVEPVGYPNSSTVCGIPGCKNQGVIWLDDAEQNQYANGERIFPGPNNNFTKMRTADAGVRRQ